MKIHNRQILVTGGCGFIGSHLVEALVKKGNSVTILDNLATSTTKHILPLIQANKVTFIQGDISDGKTVSKILENHDLVFHFAADPDVRNSVANPLENFNTNVNASLVLFEQMRLQDVNEIVFASSGGTVYGDKPPHPTTEQIPLSPISPYGASKAACEMYLSAYSGSYGFTAAVLRYANIIGPRSNHGIIYDFYHKLIRNPRTLEILGNGNQRKSYLYIDDCISASLEVTQATTNGYCPINIGVEEQITPTEIAQQMISTLGLQEVELCYTGGDRGWKGDVPTMEMGYEQLSQLGWHSRFTIREGITEYVKWLVAQTQ